jgi:hypothetical protein
VLSSEDEALIKQLAGIDAVYCTDILLEHLARYARENSIRALFTPFSPVVGSSMSRNLAVDLLEIPPLIRSTAVLARRVAHSIATVSAI